MDQELAITTINAYVESNFASFEPIFSRETGAFEFNTAIYTVLTQTVKDKLFSDEESILLWANTVGIEYDVVDMVIDLINKLNEQLNYKIQPARLSKGGKRQDLINKAQKYIDNTKKDIQVDINTNDNETEWQQTKKLLFVIARRAQHLDNNAINTLSNKYELNVNQYHWLVSGVSFIGLLG